MTETKEPIFDEQGWCYDMEMCPVDEDVIISGVNDININFTVLASRREGGDFIGLPNPIIDTFKQRTGIEVIDTFIYAWRPFLEPAKLPEPPKVFVTGKEALQALIDGKFLKTESGCTFRFSDEKNNVQVTFDNDPAWRPISVYFNDSYEVLDEIPSNPQQ